MSPSDPGLDTQLIGRERYLLRAFLVQYNLILLFGAALFALASASAMPLAVGLALEVVWLVIGPNLPWFRRFVDRNRAQAPAAQGGESSRSPRHESPPLAVKEALGAIEALIVASGDPELGRALENWRTLEATFVRLWQGNQRLSRFLTDVPEAEIEQEIGRLNAAFEAETELSVRFARRQAINLMQRRLAQRERISSTHHAIEIEIETIITSLSYLRSQAVAMGAGAELAREIAVLAERVSSAAALETDLTDVLGPARTGRALSAQA